MHAKLVLSSCVKNDDGLKVKGVILKQFEVIANYSGLEKWGTLQANGKKLGRKRHSESCSVQKEGKGVGLHGSGAVASA